MPSRRRILQTTAGIVALTGGCTGLDSEGGTPQSSTDETGDDGETPDPARIVEDFETNGLEAYEGDTEGFEIEEENFYHGSTALLGDNPGSDSFNIWDTDRESAPRAGERFRFNINLGETERNGGAARLYFAVQSPEEWIAVGVDGGNDVGGLALNINNETRGTGNFDVPYDEWLELEVKWGTDGVIVARVYRPETPESILGAAAVANAPYESGGIGWKMLDSTGEPRWVDYLRVVGSV